MFELWDLFASEEDSTSVHRNNINAWKPEVLLCAVVSSFEAVKFNTRQLESNTRYLKSEDNEKEAI